jgi:hypothetical protein
VLGSSEVLFVLAAMLVTEWGVDGASAPSGVWRRAGVANRGRFGVGFRGATGDCSSEEMVVSHSGGLHGEPTVVRQGSVVLCASCVLDGLFQGVDLGDRSVSLLVGLVVDVSIENAGSSTFEVRTSDLMPFLIEALGFRDGDAAAS